MADAREQNMAGHTPIDPVFEDRGQDGPGIGDARSAKLDMGQGLPPIRRPPARSGTASGAVVVISSALALVFGGAGAWAYERYLAHPSAEKPAAASPTQGRDSETQKNLAHMDDRIKSLSDQCNNLSGQYKQLQARLEAIPKPAPLPDLAPIEEKVAQVGQLSQQVETIGKKFDPVPEQLVQYEKKVTELDAKLDALRKEVSAAHDRTPTGRSREGSSTSADRLATGEGAENAPPSSEKGESSVDAALESGVSEFRGGRYSEAYKRFRRVLPSDDARVWYYAALSYGLASSDWGKMTQSMVEKGVSREKAGQPQKSAIDAAFAGLTKETGKDWLDFYRQRAR
jgi:chaperonin cofactor prefoldin